MYYNVGENVFDKFFSNRESLIRLFKKGDISKREFIEEHYNFIQRLNLKPFKYRIDSFEKGIYNYQYYNMLAKYSSMKARDTRLQEKHPQLVLKLKRDSQYYYSQKDKSTLRLLEYLDFYNIEAYFIKAQSAVLNDKLYEIVLKDFDNVIFHSISPWLLERLRDEGVFHEVRKKSIIDKYVNEKY